MVRRVSFLRPREFVVVLFLCGIILFRFNRNDTFAGLSQGAFPNQEKYMSNDKQNGKQSGRRHFSPEDKMNILRLHLLEKVPISEVCEKHQIIPTQFYQWQKTFFENGAAAFAKASGPRVTSQTERKLARLEEKLQRKDEVIAEIMAEHIQLKKELGES